MGRFIEQKYPATELANEFAKFALNIEDERINDITKVSDELDIPYEKVSTEFRFLRLYMIESAFHTISSECEAGEFV